jgi:phosphohistidine phosphatase
MKRLSLLRHAKSDWHDPALTDFQRPLNGRGRQAAHAMGGEMRALGLAWDCIVASPAVRVTETIDGLQQSYGAINARYDERIYLASLETLLEIVHGASDACASLLIVGHNPGMERLALTLSRGGALHDQVAEKYPTGALAEISFAVEHWRDVRESAGTLERFLRPRDLS